MYSSARVSEPGWYINSEMTTEAETGEAIHTATASAQLPMRNIVFVRKILEPASVPLSWRTL